MNRPVDKEFLTTLEEVLTTANIGGVIEIWNGGEGNELCEIISIYKSKDGKRVIVSITPTE